MKNKNKPIDELSLISKHMAINGDINGMGDLKIDGKVEGNITLEGKLILTEGSSIAGNITANNFICNGLVIGNVVIKEKLTLESKSKISGDIKTKLLIIEEGAEINGKCIASKNSAGD